MLRAALVALISFAASLHAGEDTYAEGRRLVQSGDLASAARVLAAVVEREPDNGPAWWLHGYALHAQGDHAAAVASHERAAEFPSLEANAAYNAACAHAQLGHVDEGLAWLRRARDAGFANRVLVTTDAELDPLRALDGFAELVPPILRGADAFVEPVRVLLERHGTEAGGEYGWVARVIGDLDGDGALDFVTSAPSAHGGSGMVEAVSSATNERLFAHVGRNGERLGNCLAPAGDVDGDGVPDAAVGAPAVGSATAPGAALVYSGDGGAVAWRAEGDEPGQAFGFMISGVGDVDDDGHDDVAVGATRHDGAAGVDCGAVFVLSGVDGSRLYAIEGRRAGDQFGSSVDASRDAHGLLVVGAMGAPGGGAASAFRLHADRAEPLFTIEPGDASAALGQYFVSVLGDVDDDGVPDVYAADFSDSSAGPGTGRIVVHSGADGERLLVLDGAQPGEGFGTSPSNAGDVDGDGAADLIVGAWQHASAAPSGGRCTLHSGRDGRVLATYTCKEANDTFGFDAVGIGDVDGDGGVDFLLTSAWADTAGPKTGRVFILAGPTPDDL